MAPCHRPQQDGGRAHTWAARGRTTWAGGWKTITWPPLTDLPYLL